jgi:hypothetical protein
MPENEKINLARIVFEAYPHSYLLPIDPEQQGRDLKSLQVKVTTKNIGEDLFRFLKMETIEGGPCTLDEKIRLLQQAREDIDVVLQDLHVKNRHLQKWKCPDCSRVVECSYEDLVEVGNPYCSDCDIEMQLA